jgi:NitT/TauT family transport system ATP-binding protein
VSNNPDRDKPNRRLADMHPIAKVSLSEVLGLVEAVDEVGGQTDAASVAREFDMDLDRLGPVIDAAEFLGLMNVEEGDLKNTDLSAQILSASQKERKAIIRGIIENVPVFREVTDLFRQKGKMKKPEVLEVLTAHVGTHAAQDYFDALVYWGRYVELIRYDSETEEISLRHPTS